TNHLLLAALALLAEHFAQLLELLAKLLLLFLGHLLAAHAVDVLGALVEILRRHAEISQQIFGGLGQLAIESIELPPDRVLLLLLAIEPFELALALLEQ